jgi:hypothetical protein
MSPTTATCSPLKAECPDVTQAKVEKVFSVIFFVNFFKIIRSEETRNLFICAFINYLFTVTYSYYFLAFFATPLISYLDTFVVRTFFGGLDDGVFMAHVEKNFGKRETPHLKVYNPP